MKFGGREIPTKIKRYQQILQRRDLGHCLKWSLERFQNQSLLGVTSCLQGQLGHPVYSGSFLATKPRTPGIVDLKVPVSMVFPPSRNLSLSRSASNLLAYFGSRWRWGDSLLSSIMRVFHVSLQAYPHTPLWDSSHYLQGTPIFKCGPL